MRETISIVGAFKSFTVQHPTAAPCRLGFPVLGGRDRDAGGPAAATFISENATPEPQGGEQRTEYAAHRASISSITPAYDAHPFGITGSNRCEGCCGSW